MADFKETDLKSVDLVEHTDNLKEDVDVLRSLRGVAALEVAGRLEPPKKTSKRMLQLYCICGLMFLGSTMVSDSWDCPLLQKMIKSTRVEALCLPLAGSFLSFHFLAPGLNS